MPRPEGHGLLTGSLAKADPVQCLVSGRSPSEPAERCLPTPWGGRTGGSEGAAALPAVRTWVVVMGWMQGKEHCTSSLPLALPTRWGCLTAAECPFSSVKAFLSGLALQRMSFCSLQAGI